MVRIVFVIVAAMLALPLLAAVLLLRMITVPDPTVSPANGEASSVVVAMRM